MRAEASIKTVSVPTLVGPAIPAATRTGLVYLRYSYCLGCGWVRQREVAG